jgi:hypothetical protein
VGAGGRGRIRDSLRGRRGGDQRKKRESSVGRKVVLEEESEEENRVWRGGEEYSEGEE